MMLLTKEVIAKLPPLYTQDGLDARLVPVVVKFFTPWTRWTWYATEGERIQEEGEPEDWRFFGLVVGLETELGYWSLNELKSVRGPFGLSIERDRHFGPKSLYDVLIKEGQASLAEKLGPGRQTEAVVSQGVMA